MIIVDDGSSDQSRQIIHRFQAEVPIHGEAIQGEAIELIIHSQNKGLAITLDDGLRRAMEESTPSDVIVTMDADDTHNPELIKPMVEKIAEGSDVVIASRFVSGGKQTGVPGMRRILSRGASWLLGLFFPLPGVGDYTCGYRVYRGQALKKLFSVYGKRTIRSRSFAVSAELLIKLKNLGAKISAVPLVLRYDQKRGKSKIKIIPTAIEYLEIILKNLGRY